MFISLYILYIYIYITFDLLVDITSRPGCHFDSRCVFARVHRNQTDKGLMITSKWQLMRNRYFSNVTVELLDVSSQSKPGVDP